MQTVTIILLHHVFARYEFKITRITPSISLILNLQSEEMTLCL